MHFDSLACTDGHGFRAGTGRMVTATTCPEVDLVACTQYDCRLSVCWGTDGTGHGGDANGSRLVDAGDLVMVIQTSGGWGSD